MRRRLRIAVWLLVLLGVPPWLQAQEPRATGSDGEGEELVLGRISDDPAAHHASLRAILDYVVPRMADLGVRRGRVLMARDLRQMASYLRRGRVDWITETSAAALLLLEQAGGQILLGARRNGVAEYRSLIVVRRDRGLTALADLAGCSIAFQNATSTTGYYLPAAMLLDAGLGMEILLSPTDRPEPGRVGYLFARSEVNVAAWVHKRLVDAGALSDLDWNDLDRIPEPVRQDLVVLARSELFPRGLEIVRAGLSARRVERLRAILLAAASDPAAREPLRRFFSSDGFFVPDARQEAELRRLREVVVQVRERLE
ncbi:MAG: phosphate-binding protein [Lysobacteraceae bacterium]|nr:MAG: phosphate-binding protein [Xanthomonadaceae bacterium]